MQQQGKSASKDDSVKTSNIKWWILAGFLAFLAVCAFIGVTLWLGLNFEEVTERPLANTKQSLEQETSSARLDKKEQVVVGASNQKGNEDTTRRSQRDGTKSEKVKKDENVQTTTIVTTTISTDTPNGKENFEEAVVEEISKEQAETVTAMFRKSQVLGSPLQPQPIPETPPFVPIAPAVIQETSTQTTPSIPLTRIPNKKRNSTFIQTLATTAHDTVTITTPGITEEKYSQLSQVIHEKQEEAPGILDGFLNSPKEEYTAPSSFEEDIASVFLGQGDKEVRKFEIGDVVNEKGEHFMPQSFEFPHDRHHSGPGNYQYPQIRNGPVIRHSGEVFEDGVDRDGLPSLDPESLFYTPGAPERYDGEDPDLAENPFTSFLQNRLQDLYSWLSTDEDLSSKQKSVSGDNSSMSADLITLLVALNQSMNAGNSSILLGKLKEMYYNESKINVTDPALLHNSSSLVSFGLLAFDLLLLKNVQQIAWEEEKISTEEMMKDPEVLALNALFMSPEKVRQLQVSFRSFQYLKMFCVKFS